METDRQQDILAQRVKHLEEELEQARREGGHLSAGVLAVEQTATGFLVCDLDRRLSYINPALAALCGRIPAQLTGRTIDEILSPEQRPGFDAAFRQVLATGSFAGELSFTHLTKETVLTHTIATRLTDAHGAPLGIAATLIMDTLQRQSGADLEDTAHRDRGIIENIQDVYLETTPEGIIREVSPSVEPVFGFRREDLIGRSLQSFYADHEDRQRLRRELFTKGRIRDFELAVNDRSGKAVPCIGAASLIQDREGRPLKVSVTLHDISRRKGMEKALAESEERFRTIFDSVPDCIFIKDRDLRYTLVNPSVERLFGLPAEGLIGRTDEDLFGETTGDHIRSVDRRVLRGEEVEEEQHIPVNGRVVIFHVIKVPLRSNTGEVKGLCGIARDITERITAEKRQRIHHDLAKTIGTMTNLEEALDLCVATALEISSMDCAGIYLVTPEGGMELMAHRGLSEPFACAVKGYGARSVYVELAQRKQALFGRLAQFSEHLSPEEVAEGLESFGLIPIVHEDRVVGCFMCASHTREEVLESDRLALESLVAQTGSALGHIRAETLRRESDRRYLLLAQNSTDVIWTMTFDGRFSYVSPSVEALCGFTPEEVLGIPLEGYVHPASAAQDFLAIIRGELDNPPAERLEKTTLELQQTSRSGRIIDIEVSVSWVYDTEGTPVAIQGSTRDITSRKQAQREKEAFEARLHQAEKLEAIGTLAGGIAHDINNVLAIIIGYTELVRDALCADSRERANLEQVLKAGIRASDLVKQILTFSRKTISDPRPVLLYPVVREALKLLRSSLPATIEITSHIPRTPLCVMSDPTQIHQVIMNLCTNAYHAMGEDGGRLEVGLTPVEVEVPAHPALAVGSYVCLSVRDSGCGMDQATRARIFDPFFTTKEVGRGTGLGLATVHGIVSALKGAILVESEPGQGSLFQVFLPRSEAPLTRAGTSPDHFAARGSGESILLVDDEPAILRSLCSLLENLGYQVRACAEGHEALEVFKAAPEGYDLVITDQIMPRMTGTQLLDELLHIRTDLPVILASGYSEKITPEKALDLGFSAYLDKPVCLEELASVIQEVLHHNRGQGTAGA